jgi:hypothetical protein
VIVTRDLLAETPLRRLHRRVELSSLRFGPTAQPVHLRRSHFLEAKATR